MFVVFELVKFKGVIILGICNVVGSFILWVIDVGFYMYVGLEIGVVFIKVFIVQVIVLILMVF